MVLAFAAPSWVTAQTTNSPAKPMSPAPLAPLPENPDSAMAQARQMNGFDESGAKSWHIRAKYEVYDTDGDNVDSGVYEEIWKGPKRYRRSYTGPDFTQTDYASAKGLYRSGNQEWLKGPVGMVRRLVVEPFDYLGSDPQTSLKRKIRNFNQMHFVCLVKANSTMQIIRAREMEAYPQDCLDPDKPILRMALRPGVSQGVIWNNTALFQGRFVARDIKFSQFGKVMLTIHLELIEEVAAEGDEPFVPAAEAKGPLVGRIQGDMSMTNVLNAARPVYPAVAQEHHVQGKVTMQVTVGKDGSVIDVKVLSGPSLLQDAAVEAARKWRFEPMRVMGDAVEMDLKLEIGFNLT